MKNVRQSPLITPAAQVEYIAHIVALSSRKHNILCFLKNCFLPFCPLSEAPDPIRGCLCAFYAESPMFPKKRACFRAFFTDTASGKSSESVINSL